MVLLLLLHLLPPCQLLIAVDIAGPQLHAPNRSGHCRTPTERKTVRLICQTGRQNKMSDRMLESMSNKILKNARQSAGVDVR